MSPGAQTINYQGWTMDSLLDETLENMLHLHVLLSLSLEKFTRFCITLRSADQMSGKTHLVSDSADAQTISIEFHKQMMSECYKSCCIKWIEDKWVYCILALMLANKLSDFEFLCVLMMVFFSSLGA